MGRSSSGVDSTCLAFAYSQFALSLQVLDLDAKEVTAPIRGTHFILTSCKYAYKVNTQIFLYEDYRNRYLR